MFLRMILLIISMTSGVVLASQQALTIDRQVAPGMELSFSNDEHIRPKRSDFKVVNYVLMSNELGERWSVVTLKNMASGNREFEQGYLLALFADGQRKSPEEHKVDFKANETLSITVSFGQSKFPILSLHTNYN